jgi:hypothetical protein
MNPTSNEEILIDKILNIHESIKSVQEYIKENYNIESEYDDNDNMIYLWSKNVNESLNLVAAKEHILNEIGSEFVDVIFGIKQK